MTHILLIEDDPILRENTAELLELSNYKVTTAPNGKVGINLAVQITPDIIVCDIMMPELDGYSVLERLSKEEPTKYIPFIFLTAKTERKDVRKGMDLGADDYITKPFSEDELKNAIESRLAKASILHDLRNHTNHNKQSKNHELRTLVDLKNFFLNKGDVYSFAKDAIIYREAQHSNTIYLVSKGVVKCHKLDEQGKELTTDLHKPGDFFGYTSFTENMVFQETATAIKDTELAGMSKKEFSAILKQNQQLTLALIQLLTENISGVKNELLQMAYSSVQRKTANTILKFAEKLNSNPNDPIIISRNDLASVAGIATETLIRTMSSFKKQGLIEINGRNVIILDLEQLQKMT